MLLTSLRQNDILRGFHLCTMTFVWGKRCCLNSEYKQDHHRNCSCSNCLATFMWCSVVCRPNAMLCITKAFLSIFCHGIVVDLFLTEWYTTRLSYVHGDVHVNQDVLSECWIPAGSPLQLQLLQLLVKSIWFSFVHRPNAILWITKAFLNIISQGRVWHKPVTLW